MKDFPKKKSSLDPDLMDYDYGSLEWDLYIRITCHLISSVANVASSVSYDLIYD